MPGDSQEQQALPLEFTGSGSEYFRIWIVNCILTVMTLGIYSAWAKVRRLQYFYQNTALDGSAFDYHGNPKSILKGRIIAFALLAAYKIAFEFSLLIGGFIALLLLLLMPWFVRQTLRFRMHNSSYRGLRFHFNGSTRQAYAALFLPLLLFGALSWAFFYFTAGTPALMLLLPFFMLALYLSLGAKAHYLLKNFQHDKSAFGQSRFRFTAVEGDFTRVYGMVLGLGLILALVTLLSFHPEMPAPRNAAPDRLHGQVQPFEPTNCNTASVAEEDAGNTTNKADNADASGEVAEADAAEGTCTPAPAPLTDAQKKQLEQARWYFRIGPTLGILFAYLFLSAPFFETRIHNLVWNQTALDRHRLQSKVQARRLYWIHFTNWLGIIFTIGLFKPFAAVRLYRYKVACLSLLAFGDLEQFVGHQADEVAAAGQEIGEAFDLDLGF